MDAIGHRAADGTLAKRAAGSRHRPAWHPSLALLGDGATAAGGDPLTPGHLLVEPKAESELRGLGGQTTSIGALTLPPKTSIEDEGGRVERGRSMGRVNLFSFATSELSQDAFLCWMAAVSRSDDEPLAEAGRRFLAWLWQCAGREPVDPGQFALQREPERQVERIDVLLHASVSGAPVTFLIEDKTDTTQHSGQLGRYRAAVERRLRDVVPIYFKTGYHFGEDEAATKSGYTVIDLKAWVAFLERLVVENDILADYRDHVRHLLDERTARLAALWTDRGFETFREDDAQCEFLRRLGRSCGSIASGDNPTIHRGRNVGGTPWTHLAFAWFEKTYDGSIAEALFHRIDQRKGPNGQPGFYLSTRQWANVSGNARAKQAKVLRLRNLRAAFDAAVRESNAGLVFSTPAGDNQGANESEIGILFFDGHANTTQAVVEAFPKIHRAFLEKLGLSPTAAATTGARPDVDGRDRAIAAAAPRVLRTIEMIGSGWMVPSEENCFESVIEGSPSFERHDEMRREARSARAEWRPSAHGLGLVAELQTYVGHTMLVELWNSSMELFPDAGPNPILGCCRGVEIRADANGFEQAYLVLADPREVSCPEGSSAFGTYPERDESTGLFRCNLGPVWKVRILDGRA